MFSRKKSSDSSRADYAETERQKNASARKSYVKNEEKRVYAPADAQSSADFSMSEIPSTPVFFIR
jgi:hypothetical protein